MLTYLKFDIYELMSQSPNIIILKLSNAFGVHVNRHLSSQKAEILRSNSEFDF